MGLLGFSSRRDWRLAGEMPDIWLEKYRPIKFEDVVGNTGAVSILRSHAAAGTFPHLLLTGPPGCGKTTVVHCLAREHLGSFYEQGCIELNASDDRGIDVVREKIKGFAQQKVSLPEGKLKVIILDEADSMTQAAQQAMRRTMEIYSQTTRFALACNISSKIIEPIQSRCAILRFGRISDEDMMQRLKLVLEKETAPYDQSGLEALIFAAEGDMRNALNGAQSTFNAFGEINRNTVFRMNDQPQPEKIKGCLEASLKKDMKGTFAPMHEIWHQGYSATDIISTFSRTSWRSSGSIKSSAEFGATVAGRSAMGCSSSKKNVAGHGVGSKHRVNVLIEHIEPLPLPVRFSREISMERSYDTWKWSHLPKGVAGPPERKMHDALLMGTTIVMGQLDVTEEKHMNKLNTWLSEIEDEPSKLYSKLDQATDDLDNLSHLSTHLGLPRAALICDGDIQRVAKQIDAPEHVKLEWLKEIGLTHARVTAGAQNLLQLDAMVANILMVSERVIAFNSHARSGRVNDIERHFMWVAPWAMPQPMVWLGADCWTQSGWRKGCHVLQHCTDFLSFWCSTCSAGISASQKHRAEAVGSAMLGAAAAVNKAKIICQQCLAPGHWTYECKNGSTYQVRASASRQLRQKRFKQAFLEEEAPAVPHNAFLGDDRMRFGTRKEANEPPEKKPKTEKDDEKKEKKEKKKKKKSSSSSSSDSSSSSSSS
eukprot:s75_g8.t2